MSSVKEELIKSANEIREKYRQLKRGKFMLEEERIEQFKPITEKLEQLVRPPDEENLSIVPVRNLPQTPIRTPSRIPMIQERPPPMALEFGQTATKYLSNYFLPPTKKTITDTTYGIRKDPNSNNFHIGNEIVEIANDDITVGDKVYLGTDGLWQLLTLKDPNDYTEDDLGNYKEILENTSAHKKGFRVDAPISSNKYTKYTKIIAPLFSKTGEGMRELSKSGYRLYASDESDDELVEVPEQITPDEKVNEVIEPDEKIIANPIDFWNNINETVNRLRQLVMSRAHGKKEVEDEIESIIEELVKEGIVSRE